MAITPPVKGRRFHHKHFIDSDLNPSLCQVTRVAEGMIYYGLLDEKIRDATLPAPLKASLKARTEYFAQHVLGHWENEALPRSDRAKQLRRWAAGNDIREVLPLTDRARLVAEYLHAKDRDKANQPYMEHIQAVADGVFDEDGKVVAYLHDAKEDHGVTDLDLAWLGFGPEHILGINGVTKLPGERGEAGYHFFVARAARHPLSRAVKLADLRHNAILGRIPSELRTEKDVLRVERYQREIAFLESLPGFREPAVHELGGFDC